MRYRKLTATGDYTYGQNGQNFYVNTPAGVGQAIKTRLAFFLGQWYLDLTQGTPWFTEVIGFGTTGLYDQMLQQVILQTPGVLAIVAYTSSLNGTTRALTVTTTVSTLYGNTTVTTTAPINSGFGFNFGGDFGN